MAIDKRLQVFDAEGNPVDYDILATDVKFNDGEDLPTKLAELEEEIGEGGYTPPPGGIPATDLAPAVQTSLGKADSAYQKPASGIPKTDLEQSVQGTLDKVDGKVDKVPGKGLSTNDYTTEDKTKLANLPSNPVQSVTINGTAQTKDTNGNVNVSVPTVILDDAPTAGSNNGVKSGGVKQAIDDKLTQVVVNEISEAADIITIDDADLAFIDDDGNIAMRVAEGHVETANFDSRQVATNTSAIQQLQSQIGQGGGSGQTNLVVKEDDDAALDFADTAGNVVLRVAKDGQIKTKAFDSAAMNVFKQMKLDKPQCVCHGYGAANGHANSITYFRNAIANGYEAFEVDAVNCSDGIPVCTHHYDSYSVKRKSDDETVSLQFSEIASDELVDGYTWADGEPIALLTDVIWYICYVKRFPLFVDGQGMDSASRKYASDYAEEIGVGEFVFHFCNGATSPIPTGVARLNMVLYPGSASDVQSMYLTYKKPNNNLMFSVNGKTDEVIRAIADAAHALGCQTYTWTFGTAESVRQQLELGADFIITSGIVNSQI